ncbi:MAG: 16S rRNA (adenine(1518)-N(6)/adenine(1519)-N(6))-dimethyltransferase RsmA [Eubacteriales bacterium]|nr:16S rRNA (adenine(1518)-N(6)/adenine(1519)-N(6))-dimethyltransferase RsmA [Eubacteriales bacterium]
MAKHPQAGGSGQSYGQHFLFDPSILSRMADGARIGPADAVLEIGPGLGTLTKVLAQRAQRVAAVEIDKKLIASLRSNLAAYDNVQVVNEDVLKTDLAVLWRESLGGKPFKVVANLPYYVTTAIVQMLLGCGLPLLSVTVMIQKEVAQKIMIAPGQKGCCALSALVHYYAQPRILFPVPAGAFSPPPKVDSAVLHLEMLPEPRFQVCRRDSMHEMIRCAFAMRRKTMKNNLCATYGLSAEHAERILAEAGVPAGARGESLTLEQLAALCNAVARGAEDKGE